MKEYKIKADNGVTRVEFFNEHWYEVDLFAEGKTWMPSVTLVINEGFPKGIGYEKWLMDTGNESKVIAREAMESGSLLHNMIELMVKGEPITITDYPFSRHEWEKLVNFREWFKYHRIETIATETIVWHDQLKVAGTVDFVGRLNGIVTLFDWKTGNNIYESSAIQVSAYMTFWNKMVEYGYTESPRIEQAAVVHVGAKNRTFKDNNGPGIQVVMADELNDFDTFMACYKIYKRRNPEHKPPHNVYPTQLIIGD